MLLTTVLTTDKRGTRGNSGRKKARGASVLERKRHESTQSAREDRPTSVGVVEAARSSRVTQTISSVHNRPHGFGKNIYIDHVYRIVASFDQLNKFSALSYVLLTMADS